MVLRCFFLSTQYMELLDETGEEEEDMLDLAALLQVRSIGGTANTAAVLLVVLR